MLKKINIKFTNRLINHGPLSVISAEFNNKKTFTPIAWNMPVEQTPPLLAITVSKENFVNTLIRKSKQFCVNIPDITLLETVKKLGSVSGKDVDKIKTKNLKVKRCVKIDADYWSECAAIIECKLMKIVNVGDVDIFIGEAVYCRANENFENGCWLTDKGATIHHLGGGKFVTVNKCY